MIVAVTFGSDGQVTKCRLVSSIAPADLQQSTEQYISLHWHDRAMAGRTVTVPITYALGSDPEPKKPRSSGTAVFSVTFGSDGHVVLCQVLQTSGDTRLVDASVTFIKKHWHNPRYAGKTVTVPLVFDLSQNPMPPAP